MLYQHVKKAIQKLKHHHIEHAEHTCLYLLEEKYGLKKEQIILDKSLTFSKKELKLFLIDIQKLCQHMPLDYLLESSYFMGSTYHIQEGVFIPRPETELLVSEISTYLKKHPKKKIIEIGCGSGIISCELAKIFPKLSFMAWDRSKKAIKISQKNAKTFSLKNITFFCESAFLSKRLQNDLGHNSLIVSNPPYISKNETDLMDHSVLKYEPKRALFSSDDGLAFIKKLMQLAKKSQTDLFFELGIHQAKKLNALYPNLDFFKDKQQINRVCFYKTNY